MSIRTCQICGYPKAPAKKNCPSCGWSASAALKPDDKLAEVLSWESQMIGRIEAIYPVGMAPAGAKPLDPMSISIVLALRDTAFSDDADKVASALDAKSHLLLRLAKIRAGEAGANAIYDYRLSLSYGGENNVILAADKELLILWAHFTPITARA